MNIKWTALEKQLIMDTYNYRSDKAICQLLAEKGFIHTLDAIRKYRQRLSLKKNKGRLKKEKEDIKEIATEVAQETIKSLTDAVKPIEGVPTCE